MTFRSLHEAQLAYARLDIQYVPGDREWMDRLRCWSDVEQFGREIYKYVMNSQEHERLIAQDRMTWKFLSSCVDLLPGTE